MNKKILIIGVVVAIIVIYYLLTKKRETGNPVQNAIDGNVGNLSSLTGTNKAAVTDDSISPEDLEYNELINEYKQKARRSPDPSWTISQLKNRISEIDEINKAVSEYYALEGEQSKTEDELSNMSIQEIQREIQREQEEIQREQEKKDEEYLKNLLERFIATCNDHGGIWNPAAAKGKQWDITVFNEIKSLNDTNLKKLNNMVASNSKRLCYPENYSATKKYWIERKSLAKAIPTGTLCTYRTNASAAKAFRDEMNKRIK